MRRRLHHLFWILVVILAIPSFAALILAARPAPEGGIARVILRYDDYFLVRKDLYSANAIPLEQDFLFFLLRKGINVSIAVVPFGTRADSGYPEPVPQERLDLLKGGITRGSFEISLHGFSHSNHSTGRGLSEFAGMPLQTQETWIRQGKNRISDLLPTAVEIFVPPFNAWDNSTIIALRDNDISILSAQADHFPASGTMDFFPYTMTPNELKAELANGTLDRSKLVVLNIHPHDLITENGKIGIAALESLINGMRDPASNIVFLTFHQAKMEGYRYSPSDLAALSTLWTWLRFWENFPPFRLFVPNTSLSAYRPFYSGAILYSLRAALWLAIAALAFLLFEPLTSIISGHTGRLYLCLFLALVLLGFILLPFVWQHGFGYSMTAKRSSSAFFLLGACGALVWPSLNRAKTKRVTAGTVSRD